MTGPGAEGGSPRRRSPLASIAVYAAAALLGTALFIFLHYLGNRIHYRAAAQRFAAEIETDRPNESFAAGFNTPFEYCKLSTMVLAGSFLPSEIGSNGFRDALLLKGLAPQDVYYDYCDELADAVNGVRLYEEFSSTQYWWGSKALYAVMLRAFSVQDIRLLIRYAAYAGWITLAAALLLLAPRTLVMLAPLIVFGGLFSGIRWFSGVPNGMPYAWTVWAAVALVVVMRARLPAGMTPEKRLRLTRLVCFAAGMVAAYLWLGDAITVLLFTLIGLLVYFGYDHQSEPARRARLAGGCVGLCVAGFAASYALGQAAKMGLEACLVPDWFAWRAACEGAPQGGLTWRLLTSRWLFVLGLTVEGSITSLPAGTAGVLETYWQVGLGSVPAGRILTGAAALACAAAAGAAALQARGGRPAPLRAVGWIAALMALAAVQLLVPDDLIYRRGRYLFVPYALTLCAALAAVLETGLARRAANAANAARRALARSGAVRRAARLDGLPMLLAALGGVGALLVLLREAAYGPGLTADSAWYVSAARNLLDGNGLVTFLGAPYRSAPLFPLTLAGAGLFGVDAVTASGYVNAAAFGLTVYAVTAWVRSRIRSRLLVIWAGCACVLSTSLAEVAVYAWPEIPFILFAVASLSTLDRFLRTGRRASLLLAAAAAAAACLTHYGGVALIGSGALLLLLPRIAAVRNRLADAAIWSGAAAAPVGAWLVSNLVVSGSSLAVAGPGGFLPLPSLHTATSEVVRWLIGGAGLGLLDRLALGIAGPGAAEYPHAAVLGLRMAVLLVPAAGAGYLLARARPGLLPARHAAAAVPPVFAATYALYLLIALPAAGVELQLRHLAPMFPPLLVTATVVLDRMLPRVRSAGRGLAWRRLAAVLLFSLWLVPQAGANADHVEQWLANGGGYASRRWSESAVVRYLNAGGPPAAALHGTDGAALYLLTTAADTGPHQLPRELSPTRARLAAEEAAGREHNIVWFYQDSGRHGYDLETLIRTPGMEVAAAMDDGVILRSGAPDGTPEADGLMRPLLQDAGIGVRSGFTVYLDAAANRLIYFKNGCGDADAAARFFLHVVPVNHNDLPIHPWTFHNLDFDFDHHGFRYRGRCVAIRDLPDYRIAHLATGQHTPRDGQLWKVTLTDPPARRDFAVHLRGNALVYLKEPCAADDAQAQFFLHLRPAAAADLPAHRRAEGFDSLDFDFREYGAAADGRCRAVVPLPAYEIAGIRTGRYAEAGGGQLWSVEFTASEPPPAAPALTIAKWFDDHAAAISITYDGVSGAPNRIDELVLDEGLVLDYEIVTQRYLDQVPDWVEHDLTELVPDVVPGDIYQPMTDAAIEHSLSLTAHGFGFFGHGHWHVDHDALTYAQAYDSFRLCFEVMEDLGLEPVAYAYPRGAGGEAETQQALADAGFLAGRLSFPALGQTPYIVPEAATAPENWFFLPGLTMESIRFRECEWCINDTSELVPILDQALARTAWIIPVYHNIGRGAGWGFYEWEDFEGDVRAIAARDFWVAPMNDVVLYLRERERAEAAMQEAPMQVIERDGLTRRIAFVLADGLDDDRFDQPLTLRFRRPADWFGAPLEVTQNGRLVARIAAFAETAAISLPPNEEPYVVQPSHPPPGAEDRALT